MVLPIVAYGHPVLREVAKEIDADHPQLDKLVEDMWETMYGSSGVGLAAPQVNRAIRLFVVDSTQIFENLEDEDRGVYPDEPGIKQVFINPRVLELSGEPWAYNEGCLSIPKIREDVFREECVRIEYVDEAFQRQERTFHGLTARVILHEYDHLEGRLFIDRISVLKRKLLKKRLDEITAGKVKVDYRMLLPKR